VNIKKFLSEESLNKVANYIVELGEDINKESIVNIFKPDFEKKKFLEFKLKEVEKNKEYFPVMNFTDYIPYERRQGILNIFEKEYGMSGYTHEILIITEMFLLLGIDIKLEEVGEIATAQKDVKEAVISYLLINFDATTSVEMLIFYQKIFASIIKGTSKVKLYRSKIIKNDIVDSMKGVN
jgi:hypothetical protein